MKANLTIRAPQGATAEASLASAEVSGQLSLPAGSYAVAQAQGLSPELDHHVASYAAHPLLGALTLDVAPNTSLVIQSHRASPHFAPSVPPAYGTRADVLRFTGAMIGLMWATKTFSPDHLLSLGLLFLAHTAGWFKYPTQPRKAEPGTVALQAAFTHKPKLLVDGLPPWALSVDIAGVTAQQRAPTLLQGQLNLLGFSFDLPYLSALAHAVAPQLTAGYLPQGLDAMTFEPGGTVTLALGGHTFSARPQTTLALTLARPEPARLAFDARLVGEGEWLGPVGAPQRFMGELASSLNGPLAAGTPLITRLTGRWPGGGAVAMAEQIGLPWQACMSFSDALLHNDMHVAAQWSLDGSAWARALAPAQPDVPTEKPGEALAPAAAPTAAPAPAVAPAPARSEGPEGVGGFAPASAAGHTNMRALHLHATVPAGTHALPSLLGHLPPYLRAAMTEESLAAVQSSPASVRSSKANRVSLYLGPQPAVPTPLTGASWGIAGRFFMRAVARLAAWWSACMGVLGLRKAPPAPTLAAPAELALSIVPEQPLQGVVRYIPWWILHQRITSISYDGQGRGSLEGSLRLFGLIPLRGLQSRLVPKPWRLAVPPLDFALTTPSMQALYDLIAGVAHPVADGMAWRADALDLRVHARGAEFRSENTVRLGAARTPHSVQASFHVAGDLQGGVVTSAQPLTGRAELQIAPKGAMQAPYLRAQADAAWDGEHVQATVLLPPGVRAPLNAASPWAALTDVSQFRMTAATRPELAGFDTAQQLAWQLAQPPKQSAAVLERVGPKEQGSATVELLDDDNEPATPSMTSAPSSNASTVNLVTPAGPTPASSQEKLTVAKAP